MIFLIEKFHRLNYHLQHLVVLQFPRTQESYLKYLELSQQTNVFSKKLLSNDIYTTSIVKHLDPPSYETWYNNGQLKIQLWVKDGKLHREGDQPAEILWFDNGQSKRKAWFKDGLYYRDGDQPAIIEWYYSGQLKCQNWYVEGMCIKEEKY